MRLDAQTKRKLYAMARVLEHNEPELGNPSACRQVLANAGFTAKSIADHLPRVQHMARQMRVAEAERLATEWQAANERLIEKWKP